MDIGKVLKKFQYNILTQSGISVTPEQVGLKNKDFESPFSSYLNGVNSNGTTASAPTPPTPPENPNDLEAQKLYNEQLLAYTQEMAAYQQRLFSLMVQQFQQSQQFALSQQQRSTTVTPASNESSILGTGGIL